METCSRRSVLNADILICLAGRWEKELNILDSWWHLAQSKLHSSSSGLSICDCIEIFAYIIASLCRVQKPQNKPKDHDLIQKSTTKETILWYITQTTIRSTTSTGISDHIYDRQSWKSNQDADRLRAGVGQGVSKWSLSDPSSCRFDDLGGSPLWNGLSSLKLPLFDLDGLLKRILPVPSSL
jgi:hypothetical protein